MASKKHANKQKPETVEKNKNDAWYRHPAVWVGPLALLILLFIGLVTWRPMSDWLSSIADKTDEQTATPPQSTLQTSGSGQTPVTITTTGGGTPGGTGGTGGSGGGGNGSGGGTPTGDTAADDGLLPEFYGEVGNGDSLQQLASIAGTPDDCIETVLALLGLQKVCTWHNEDSSVTVTLINDQVVAKNKVGF